ncbi:hypothetical protein JW756_04530 [Candidatus Woesearchaeota archaeon]|nr:hypothetical protein [Candidatus Woesearchaeota archaeon]
MGLETDVFGAEPYSPKRNGSLEDYLRKYNGSMADNLFFGSKYFFVMKDKGLLIPNASFVRVDKSPLPDDAYFVNSDFLLESRGTGEPNMSCMGAQKGVYDPKKALKGKFWSIYGFRISGKKSEYF